VARTFELSSGDKQLHESLEQFYSVAERGFLPPGANVCVAAPSSQIGNDNY